MAASRKTTTDYAGRQVDVELLQSIRTPDVTQRVSISNVKHTPKMVTGLEKMVQRYTNLLLSYLDSTHFDSANGTDFLGSLLGGFQNLGVLQSVFTVANSGVLSQLGADNSNLMYGPIPDDENIVSAVLLRSDIDIGSSTVLLQVQLTSVSGDTAVFIIPATSAR